MPVNTPSQNHTGPARYRGGTRLQISEAMNQDYYKKGVDKLRYTPTTLEQERELFEKARAGDKEAREFLIQNHLLFAANRARGLVQGKIPDDEVISAANEALMKAIDGFNPSHGCRFTRYLMPFIKGAIARLWRDQGAVRNVKTVEFEEYAEEEQTPVIMENSPAENLDTAEREKARLHELHKGMEVLNARERALVQAVYEHNKSFAELARARGVSRQAVEQALNRALDKMRGAMKRVS